MPALPRQVGSDLQTLGLLRLGFFALLVFCILPPQCSSNYCSMTRFTALLLLAPAVLAFDYTIGVGKDETT
jgi:hypothetical protein